MNDEMRSQDDVQRAHDRLTSIILGEVPYGGVKAPVVAACDALCWVLRHDHNRTFEENLAKIDASLLDQGFVLERIPETAPFLSRVEWDLLKALKALLDVCPFATDAGSAAIHRQAEAAIQKAEGRS